MDIHNNVEGLRTLLGVSSTETAKPQAPQNAAAKAVDTALAGDRATLSDAAASVAQAASGSDVRTEKVASIQAALAAGTYNVPASAVASKIVDAMLGAGNPAER